MLGMNIAIGKHRTNKRLKKEAKK